MEILHYIMKTLTLKSKCMTIYNAFKWSDFKTELIFAECSMQNILNNVPQKYFVDSLR